MEVEAQLEGLKIEKDSELLNSGLKFIKSMNVWYLQPWAVVKT